MRVLLVVRDSALGGRLAGLLRRDAYAVDVLDLPGGDPAFRAASTPYDLIAVALDAAGSAVLCRELRRRGVAGKLMALVAEDSAEARAAALDAGADDALSTPWHPRELTARARALLRRGGTPIPDPLAVGVLEIEPSAQRVRLGEAELQLTATEYRLLEYFARNVGRVVGRAEISDHVWDDHYDPFSNLIEVYVHRLRQKLEAVPGAPRIETRRGAGYRMVRAAATPHPPLRSVVPSQPA